MFFPLGSQLRCLEAYRQGGKPQDAIPRQSKDGRQGLNRSVSDLAFIRGYPLLEKWGLVIIVLPEIT